MSDKRESNNRDRLTAATIARAFGITPAAASRLARALTSRTGKFKSIAEEFHRLGETEFGETYLTEAMRLRILEARREPAPSGPSPDSKSHAGFHFLHRFDDGTEFFVFVRWTEADDRYKKGWTWRNALLGEDGKQLIGDQSYVRLRTSRAALAHAFTSNGFQVPREFPPALDRAEVIARLKNNPQIPIDNPAPQS
jgi:hypothetical protein